MLKLCNMQDQVAPQKNKKEEFANLRDNFHQMTNGIDRNENLP